ncbi:2-oxoglutarate dehydrogenase E1 component [bacterium]|nr:2-oxoglutarate dehydrogenase E1 component [bacterium]
MNDGGLKKRSTPSYLNPLNVQYIEEIAEEYKKSPQNVDESWRYFFEGMALSQAQTLAKNNTSPVSDFDFELKVIELIQNYREMGYLIADVNPLNRGIKTHPLLALSRFGLTEADLNRTTKSGHMLGMPTTTLKAVIETLTKLYCSPASVEYGHIEDPESRLWIQKRVESQFLLEPLNTEEKIRALHMLAKAEVFETFLHKRFVGQKRFSVEGTDIIIPMLDYLIDQASKRKTDEVLIGMAHRGRLNVLANTFNKDPRLLLAEFAGKLKVALGAGDVKYHMGFSQNTLTPSGNQVHLSLMPNPSHLEAVNPVLMGVARSKQKLKGDTARTRTLPVLIHGDASFAGQGSIYEVLNLSELKGYTVGGTIHIILNNQVGFTTDPSEARSTPNSTDVAKMLEIPILRVNADEPDAALRCMLMALEFRNTFKRDVVIDVLGYRRYGHNEADEPGFTQPLMYEQIKSHPRPRELYAQRLIHNKIITEEEVQKYMTELDEGLDSALAESQKATFQHPMQSFGDRWKDLERPTKDNIFLPSKTGVNKEALLDLATEFLTIPSTVNVHPKVQKIYEDRKLMAEGKKEIDWGMAEMLTYASLIKEGYSVRLAGQDVERGTFSHRHSVLADIKTGKKYSPLNHLTDVDADFDVVNSPLSEYAALGFEFGQSLSNPEKLSIWEAQFGDFANGAQIIIDQFITSSAVKWRRYSGLVMQLPHGYEGQGPEHSSARPERYLMACAKNNIQVMNLTTPVQLFHALRRQMHRKYRLPLIIFTPKSLLRHPRVHSPLEDFKNKHFYEVLDDAMDMAAKENVKKIVLCSGKIYYDLLAKKEELNNETVALIRLEQLYPFPKEILINIMAGYKNATEIIWCQEEPKNMGPWGFVYMRMRHSLNHRKMYYVGRKSQASPADGYMHLHLQEQKRIVTTVFED